MHGIGVQQVRRNGLLSRLCRIHEGSVASIDVPFLDLEKAYKELQAEIESAVLASLRKGWYVLGPEVDAFEKEFGTYCGASHCIGVASGLDALYLALRSMGVGQGDEVIVPSHTYIATWLAVSLCGARPVPVEPDLDTFNIDPARIEPAITQHTKVIIPVHMYGLPADLNPILDIARKHQLKVLEDAAQAHGACYKGARIGAHGLAVAWSFYPGKNLGALGDGGAITTNDPEISESVRLLRNYGSSTKYFHKTQGQNSRLDEVQAAVLRVKLKYLDEWNTRRASIASRYNTALANSNIYLPVAPEWVTPAWHLYVIRTPQRDSLQRYLTRSGINTLIHYPIPPHLQGAYSHLGYKQGDFPIAEKIGRDILSLPIGPHLEHHQLNFAIEKLMNKKAWSS